MSLNSQFIYYGDIFKNKSNNTYLYENVSTFFL